VLPETLRALIFDMDGLMVDSEPVWWRVEHALAKAHGIGWTNELALSCVGGGLPNVIRTMQRHGLALEEKEGVAWLVEAFIGRLEELELKPGCRELVEAGRHAGLRMAVASSSTLRLIEHVLGRFELRPLFDAVISGDHVKNAKPAPDIFLLAAERLGVSPQDAVVLEDSLAGVRAANAAGMAVVAIPEFERTPFVSLASHVLSDLHEARALLGLSAPGVLGTKP
jgi:HAD superfamily hydrolase (TIGR01509 family)